MASKQDEDPFLCGYTGGEPRTDMPAVSPADILNGGTTSPTPDERRSVQYLNYLVVQEEKPPQTKPIKKPDLPAKYPSDRS